MKNRYLFLTFVLFLIASCANDELSENNNKLNISEYGFEFELVQRNQVEIPSTSNNVICKIEDITAGQTQLTIKTENEILLDRSIRVGDVLKFMYNSENYTIECLNLENKLIGEDYGNFIINSQSKKKKIVKDETELIEILLVKIESSDIVFIRNGSEYSPKEAADHLRSKLNETNGQIKTLDAFIKNIASKSSMSGKPYLVKLKNGNILTAEKWYKEQMKN